MSAAHSTADILVVYLRPLFLPPDKTMGRTTLRGGSSLRIVCMYCGQTMKEFECIRLNKA